MTTLTDKQHRNFWRKVRVNPETGCHEWTAGTLYGGYGSFVVRDASKARGWRTVRAHRVAYQLYPGPAPDGQEICHTCDNPRCVRKEHLFAGTHAANMADMKAKGRQAHVRGLAHGATRLDAATLARMADLHAQGIGIRAIGRALGVSHSHVSRTLRGQRRQHG